MPRSHAVNSERIGWFFLVYPSRLLAGAGGLVPSVAPGTGAKRSGKPSAPLRELDPRVAFRDLGDGDRLNAYSARASRR